MNLTRENYLYRLSTLDVEQTLFRMGYDWFAYLLEDMRNRTADDVDLIPSPVDILMAYREYREEKDELEFDSYLWIVYMEQFIQDIRDYPIDSEDDEQYELIEADNQRAIDQCGKLLDVEDYTQHLEMVKTVSMIQNMVFEEIERFKGENHHG